MRRKGEKKKRHDRKEELTSNMEKDIRRETYEGRKEEHAFLTVRLDRGVCE